VKKKTRKGRSTSVPSEMDLSSQPYAPRAAGQDRSSLPRNVRELTWADFDRLVRALARDISRTFAPDAVVGVAHGGVFVGGALASALACEFYPVRISRRSRDNRVRRSPRLFGQMPPELKGKRILIVDDVASSGDTLQLARELAIKAGAKEALTTSLVTRAGGFQPGWTALSSAELVIFPWDYEPVTEDRRFDVDPEKAGA
jgi:hypoxanthine phosphoribosyltransferase